MQSLHSTKAAVKNGALGAEPLHSPWQHSAVGLGCSRGSVPVG